MLTPSGGKVKLWRLDIVLSDDRIMDRFVPDFVLDIKGVLERLLSNLSPISQRRQETLQER